MEVFGGSGPSGEAYTRGTERHSASKLRKLRRKCPIPNETVSGMVNEISDGAI